MEHAICGRPDLGEEYVCAVADASRHGHGPETSPIVRVLRVLRYPRQHALYWPDKAVEIPAVEAGCICRLPFLRQATAEELARFGSYEESLAAAQAEALAREENEDSREIVRRHMAGEYRRARTVLRIRPWEINGRDTLP